ncbi:Uncharacterised protein [Achromobacter xylosoxidans]|uniref:hypothetical protein n=1 Tax=Alcaligenes xylosoxydans xylosoxydans TaxID=85698 RepID=UPI0006C2FFDE|nr:Uncharacterised protein [Achromobacter xylosoxidans]
MLILASSQVLEIPALLREVDMRYRKLDENGDYVFGNGQADFYRDVPDAPAQAVATRLKLWTNEWFANMADGTPYLPFVLGRNTENSYDAVLMARILDTTGVVRIDEYNSTLDRDARKLSVAATITTQYGQTQVEQTI